MNIEALHGVVAAGIEWQDREGRERISPDRWGRDHGQTLVEAAHAVRECKGLMDWTRLTLSKRHWPSLFAAKRYHAPTGPEDAADKYGLRLANKMKLMGHCEGDALMDLRDAGLITITMPTVSESGDFYLKPNGYPLRGDFPVPQDLPTGYVEQQLMPWAKFGMTDLGWTVVHELDRRTASETAPTWGEFFTEMLVSG